MIRAIVVADCGSAMASLITALAEIDTVEIVRHATGRADVGPLARRLGADLVFVDELHWPPLVLSRVAEIAKNAPDAGVIVLTSTPDAGWLADALRHGAAAVAASNLDPATLARLVREVLASPTTPVSLAA